MAKWANDIVLDAMLEKVATGNQMIVTTSQPTNRANAVSNGLASVSVGPGDYTIGDTSGGRQLTVGQKASIPVTATGSATHVCIVDGSDLLYVTTVTAQTLTSGNTVTVPSWNITIADPS